MIDYLYGSKSLGVRNYTHELKHHMSASGLDVNMRGVGGVHVLSKMEQSQLRDHLLNCLPSNNSSVIHIQHDTLMFRGAGDEVDEMDNMCWFLDQMLIRYERVFITFHSTTEFSRQSWLKKPVERFMINILSRQWHNQVIPMLNRCKVLVHSEPHLQLLESQGCDSAQLFIHPTNRHCEPFKPDTRQVRVVIPGRLVDRKRVGQAIEACTCIPNSVLSVDSTNQSLYNHYTNYAADRNVDVNPIEWNLNSSEYLDQLSEHDVALVMYNDDVPLSGSIIDALRCGLVVGTTSTPSFKWFSEEYQCINTHAHHHKLGDMIMSQLFDPTSVTRDQWHADNYFVLSHESAQRLIEQYHGEPPVDLNGGTRDPLASPVTWTSKQTRMLPDHMVNTSECKEVQLYQGIPHVEYQYNLNPKMFDSGWTGLIHGPFIDDQTTLNIPSVDQLVSQHVFDKCVQLRVTNTKLKQLIEPHVNCAVHVLKLNTFVPVNQFDIDCFLSTDSRCIIHAGWWCKRFNSFNQLNVGRCWNKLMCSKPEEPTAELMDVAGDLHESVRWVTGAPNNCIHFVDQTTDDVVDEQMLHCIRSNIPVLIRRNMTAEEYLGEDYVLMFDDVTSAGELLTDNNIKLAHEQLKLIY